MLGKRATPMVALGVYWRRLREARGWTQYDLLRRLREAGLDVQDLKNKKLVWSWENAVHTPSVVSAHMIMRVLGADAYQTGMLLDLNSEQEIQHRIDSQEMEPSALDDPEMHLKVLREAGERAADQYLSNQALQEIQTAVDEAAAAKQLPQFRDVIQRMLADEKALKHFIRYGEWVLDQGEEPHQ
jgi:transcriptional regulator with XRE-family HTH domain